MSELPFHSRRSVVYARRGMAASSQPLATAAGLEILAAGGTAADAAVAMAAVLNVTEPCSTGLGGDAFALYYQSMDRRVYALNGSGRAPAALNLNRVQQAGFGETIPHRHAFQVTVPGACALWFDLLARFGRLPKGRILSTATRHADEGFPVAPITAHAWAEGVRSTLSCSHNGLELTLDGRAPRAGEVFRNPGLAHTLRLLAEYGKDAYYNGPIGEAVVSAVRQAGGVLSESDLAGHASTWEEPISTLFRGKRIWECPPNGQGLVALLALNLLEGLELGGLPPLSPARLHWLIEALRLAFADGQRWIADPDFSKAPLETLLSQDYTQERRKGIQPGKATLNPHSGFMAGSDTVYFTVIDSEGNACSFINSNYMGFGSGIVPAGFGFSLQNRGANFSLEADHPNCLEPGKRPYHTIIPAMITLPDSGELYASFGVMGGFMQPQGHVQVLLGLLEDGLDPQEALDRPRICLEVERKDGRVAVEEGNPAGVLRTLEKWGHNVRMVGGQERSLFGRGQIIRRDPVSGVLCAGSDPRADGCALGF